MKFNCKNNLVEREMVEIKKPVSLPYLCKKTLLFHFPSNYWWPGKQINLTEGCATKVLLWGCTYLLQPCYCSFLTFLYSLYGMRLLLEMGTTWSWRPSFQIYLDLVLNVVDNAGWVAFSVKAASTSNMSCKKESKCEYEINDVENVCVYVNAYLDNGC